MQRLFTLLALCLFSSVLCFVAASSSQQRPLNAPEYTEELAGQQRAKNKKLPAKKETTPQPAESSSLPEEEQPPPKSTPPEKRVEGSAKGTPEGASKAPPSKRPAAPKKSALEKLSPEMGENNIHFLLIGRWWKIPAAEVLMIVTLVPERCAFLTAMDPSVEVKTGGNTRPIGELLDSEDSRKELYRALASLTGLKPQFYIDLNLHGFVEMLDLLQRESRSAGASRRGKAIKLNIDLEGEEVLKLMSDPATPTAKKEKILLELLLAACKIQFTKSGLELLWIGFHNLKTDLSLQDLLEVRKVTQEISPFDINLTEILP